MPTSATRQRCQCLTAPNALSMVEAAGLPETYFTVWDQRLPARRLTGETFLVHGGSCGIGTTAIQLATCLRREGLRHGRQRTEKCGACDSSAPTPINYKTEDFVAVSAGRRREGRRLDPRHDRRRYFERNLAWLARDGRHVEHRLPAGRQAELNLAAVMRSACTVTGSTLRPRSVAEKGVIARRLRRRSGRCSSAARSNR